METGKNNGTALRQLRAIFNEGSLRDLTDGQLLERFATGPTESAELAFAALVERHGPMVLRVCRGVLADPHEAQDAFQATFLVLVQKSRRLWVRDSLGPWLHQVAHRSARAARSAAARRRRLERRAAEFSTLGRPGMPEALDSAIVEEIERLPEGYRAAVVLCDLEGRSHEQAARHLGWPIGTVKSRLSRARDRLRDRLTRRGLAPGAGALAAAPPIPPALAHATTAAAIRFLATRAIAPGTVASLAQGVLRTMILLKWLKTGTALILISAATSGVALIAQDGPANSSKAAPARPADGPTRKVEPGPFRFSVKAGGRIDVVRSTDVFNQVDGNSTLVKLLPNETRVKKGDEVAVFDSEWLRNHVITRKRASENVEAAFKNARLAREVAEFAIPEYLEGVYRQQHDSLEDEIAGIQAGVERANARSERIHQAREKYPQFGFRSISDVVAALNLDNMEEDIAQKATRDAATLKLTKSKLQTLEKFTKIQTVRQLESAVNRARIEERTKELAWEQEKLAIARLEDQIAQYSVRAPADGLLFHVKDGDRGSGQHLKVGYVAWKGRKLFEILDIDGPRQVTVGLPEAIVDQIKPGQHVLMDVFSIKDKLKGTVQSVAPRHEAITSADSKQKFYPTEITFDQPPKNLKAGLVVQTEILVEDRENVLTVPISAVVTYRGKDHVAVKKPDGAIDWRDVILGTANPEVVQVREGLLKGEEVLFDPTALMSPEEKVRKLGPPR